MFVSSSSLCTVSVFYQPPRSTQPGHPFVGRHNEYWWWSWPLLWQKWWVLRSSRPCHACCHNLLKRAAPDTQVDPHCVLHRVATSLCRGHVDELATEPILLLHREHRTGYRWSWNCCYRCTRFILIWKHLFHSVYGHQDMDWLWCTLSLLVMEGQYKCLSYCYKHGQSPSDHIVPGHQIYSSYPDHRSHRSIL